MSEVIVAHLMDGVQQNNGLGSSVLKSVGELELGARAEETKEF
jgi:hypothetical protein